MKRKVKNRLLSALLTFVLAVGEMGSTGVSVFAAGEEAESSVSSDETGEVSGNETDEVSGNEAEGGEAEETEEEDTVSEDTVSEDAIVSGDDETED